MSLIYSHSSKFQIKPHSKNFINNTIIQISMLFVTLLHLTRCTVTKQISMLVKRQL